MRKFKWICGTTFQILTACMATAVFAESPSDRNIQDLEIVKKFFNEGRYTEGLDIIHAHKEDMETLDPNGLKWLELFIEGSEENRDIPQLVLLFEFFPEIFKEHEQASLFVADYYVIHNRIKEYNKLRSLWQDRETKIAAWFVLDVDKLLLEGKKREAIDLLTSRSFKDKADVGRLVRLARLHADNPTRAWKYLDEAYAKAPKDPDIRSYRGKFLEISGKTHQAHNEYKEALRLDPENIYLKDLLANYYLRKQDYDSALDIFKNSLLPPSNDKIWVEALFWERVTTPLNFNWESTPPPKGKLEPLVQYLAGLKKDVFWDQEKFNLIPNNAFFLKTQQETFWLRLLNALENKEEKEAYKLLKYNPFPINSWYPEALNILKMILNYRLNGSLRIEAPLIAQENSDQDLKMKMNKPPFFEKLEELANKDTNQIPSEWHNLIMSPEIFSAVFIGMQWFEAGIQLHKLPIIPEDFPSWVAYNLTEAIYKNRNFVEALQFASVQKETPELTLLTGELTIIGGDTNAAVQIFEKIANQDSEEGYKAAWLASLIYIDQKEWKEAKRVIISQPRLVNSVLGKETLARIAHLEGNETLADRLYAAIEKTSVEARSYLARRAFAKKDWTRARALTEQLIQDYPENITLKNNLDKIMEEQNKVQKGG